MVVAIAQAVEHPDRTPAALVHERRQHTVDRREADAAGDEYDGVGVRRLEEKISRRRAYVDDIAFLDLIMEVGRAEAPARRAAGIAARAFDGDPVVVGMVPFAQAVAAD